MARKATSAPTAAKAGPSAKASPMGKAPIKPIAAAAPAARTVAKGAAKPTAKAPVSKVSPPSKAASQRAPAKTGGRAMKAVAKPVVTVTTKHMAAALAEKQAMPKKQADALLADVFGMVVGHLKDGDRVRISGIGIIEVKNRPARMGRNPATGEPIQIKASRKIAFRASKELKEAV